MKNRYLICMMAFLGLGLADLFYFNSRIIPALWPDENLTAQVAPEQRSAEVEPNRENGKKAVRQNTLSEQIRQAAATTENNAVIPEPEQPVDENQGPPDHVPPGDISPGAGPDTVESVETAAVEPIRAPESRSSDTRPENQNPQPEKEKIEKGPFLLAEEVVPFEVGESELTSEYHRKLLSGFERIEPNETTWVTIDGHSDHTGTGKVDNLLLSRQRADYVAAIMAQLGFRQNQMMVSGHGDALPLDESDTPEAFAKNRRVEIKIFEGKP